MSQQLNYSEYVDKGTNNSNTEPRLNKSHETLTTSKGDGQTIALETSQNSENTDNERGLENESDSRHKQKVKEQAKMKLQKVHDYLKEGSTDRDFLQIAEFESYDEYLEALQLISEKTSIVYRRGITEAWINNYNPALLEIWNANMDIQYITDPYSCIMYIVSYLCKGESELSQVMKTAMHDILKTDDSRRSQMKKMAHVYFHNREMSVQEAVYRVCGLRMKDSTREVKFIPTDPYSLRISLPLSKIEALAKSGDTETNIWMPSVNDKYKQRPQNDKFNQMCLAQFASEFRFIAASDERSNTKNEYTLGQNLGKIKKRSEGKEAIIRYVKYSPSENPDKYFHTKLTLYFPFRDDTDLNPPEHLSNEQFVVKGFVFDMNGSKSYVRDIIKANQTKFEKGGSEFDNALALYQESNCLEDGWAAIAPETELQRMEDTAEIDRSNFPEGEEEELPLSAIIEVDTPAPSTISIKENEISRETAFAMLRSMSATQSKVIYSIRNWCLQKKSYKGHPPFQLLVHGGAGVGKSHLIRCIEYEAKNILKDSEYPDDTTV